MWAIIGSRRVLGWGLALMMVVVVGCGGDDAGDSGDGGPETVNIALIAPLSGPYAPDGRLEVEGARMAEADINANGGIKSMGGAKVRFVIADTGGTVESVTSATQRVLDRGDISGIICCWLSSFTLAASELSERRGVPMITFSNVDDITTRGYKYIFRDAQNTSTQAAQTVPQVVTAATAAGNKPATAALIGDNTAAIVSYFENMRKVLPAEGLKINLEKVWTPPLADATSIALAVKKADPDLVFLSATQFTDAVATFRALGAVGVNKPVVVTGAQWLVPEFVEGAGGYDKIENMVMIVASGVTNAPEAERFRKRFIERTSIPFLGANTTSVYAETYILKEALEAAKSADPARVRDALSSLNITSGPATWFLGQPIKFDETGQNVDAHVIVLQWQNGQPVMVAPADLATADMRL